MLLLLIISRMKKLYKALKAVIRIIRNPWLLNKVLDDDLHWMEYIAKHHGFKNSLPVITPESLFGDFSETVAPYASLDGSSLPTDLALLKRLARTFPDCSYFEIGTWRGESVANVASVASECFTLNLSDAEMISLGLDERYINLHRHFSKDLKNVTHLQGNSLDFDFAGLGKKFDLIFIDGDHHFNVIKNDTEKVFRHLLHENSIVVWHDYACNPEKIRFEVMAGILDGCPKEYHDRIYQVGNTMCAIFIRRALETRPFESPQIPEGYFELQIKKATGC
jgi:predicted O-methyltransferase YrrM